MKTRVKNILLLATCLCLSGLFSCDLNKIDYSADDSGNVQSEAASDAYYEDISDISSTAVSVPDDTKGGRKSERKIFKILDNRFACADVTLDPGDLSTLLNPKGIITVDFKTGCQDNHGNTRKGKILVTYAGRRFTPGASITTTFDGYEINGVKVEGTHSATNTSASNESLPEFTVALTNGKLTWPDGTIATREFSYTREWIRSSTGAEDVWNVTGSAAGTNRKGHDYTMTIVEKLVYQKICQARHQKFMPSQGTEELITNNKKVGMDFGKGSCDQQVTISINGKSKQVDLSTSN